MYNNTANQTFESVCQFSEEEEIFYKDIFDKFSKPGEDMSNAEGGRLFRLTGVSKDFMRDTWKLIQGTLPTFPYKNFRLFAKHCAIKQQGLSFDETNFQSGLPLLKFEDPVITELKKKAENHKSEVNQKDLESTDLDYLGKRISEIYEKLPSDAYDKFGDLKPEVNQKINALQNRILELQSQQPVKQDPLFERKKSLPVQSNEGLFGNNQSMNKTFSEMNSLPQNNQQDQSFDLNSTNTNGSTPSPLFGNFGIQSDSQMPEHNFGNLNFQKQANPVVNNQTNLGPFGAKPEGQTFNPSQNLGNLPQQNNQAPGGLQYGANPNFNAPQTNANQMDQMNISNAAFLVNQNQPNQQSLSYGLPQRDLQEQFLTNQRQIYNPQIQQTSPISTQPHGVTQQQPPMQNQQQPMQIQQQSHHVNHQSYMQQDNNASAQNNQFAYQQVNPQASHTQPNQQFAQNFQQPQAQTQFVQPQQFISQNQAPVQPMGQNLYLQNQHFDQELFQYKGAQHFNPQPQVTQPVQSTFVQLQPQQYAQPQPQESQPLIQQEILPPRKIVPETDVSDPNYIFRFKAGDEKRYKLKVHSMITEKPGQLTNKEAIGQLQFEDRKKLMDIWKLVLQPDMPKQYITEYQIVVALHMIELLREGIILPAQLPSDLINYIQNKKYQASYIGAIVDGRIMISKSQSIAIGGPEIDNDAIEEIKSKELRNEFANIQKSHSLAFANCKKDLEQTNLQDKLLLDRSKQQNEDLKKLVASLKASMEQSKNFSDSLKSSIQTFKRQNNDNSDDHKRQILELVKNSMTVVREERNINQGFSAKITDLNQNYESFQKITDQRVAQSKIIEDESKQLKMERDDLTQKLQETESELIESIENRKNEEKSARQKLKENDRLAERKLLNQEKEWKKKLEELEKKVALLEAENIKLKEQKQASQVQHQSKDNIIPENDTMLMHLNTESESQIMDTFDESAIEQQEQENSKNGSSFHSDMQSVLSEMDNKTDGEMMNLKNANFGVKKTPATAERENKEPTEQIEIKDDKKLAVEEEKGSKDDQQTLPTQETEVEESRELTVRNTEEKEVGLDDADKFFGNTQLSSNFQKIKEIVERQELDSSDSENSNDLSQQNKPDGDSFVVVGEDNLPSDQQDEVK